jgi:hypothetical protein
VARREDPVILARYLSALANWRYTGYVEWKEVALAWVKKQLGSVALRALSEQMYKYVAAGGEVDQVPERRPEWNDYDFHYDVRLPLGDRLLYIETLLRDEDPNDPTILVVSIHDA